MTGLLRGRTVAVALVLYAAAVLARIPAIVLHGRFWAEEGTIFFARAWQFAPAEALFLPYGGYLNLAANGAALLARWTVPLEEAPFVTIGVALVFQLVPPLVLLTARDEWLRPWPVRGAALVMLLLVPAVDEVWLQTLHCQFELTLTCGLLLALDVPTGRRAIVPLAALLLAPLCGPGAIALLPLFVLRVAVDRTPGRLVQIAALAVGSVAQLALFFTLDTARAGSHDLGVLLAVVTVKDILIPFIGVSSSTGISDRIRAATLSGHVPVWAVVAPIVAFGTVAVAAVQGRAWTALWLLAGAAVTGLVGYFGAIDGMAMLLVPRAGMRYAFVPLALTALSLLVLATRPTLWRWPALVLCAWLLVVGLRSYRSPWVPTRDGPLWAEQVERWRADPAYALQLWPPPWVVSLPLH